MLCFFLPFLLKKQNQNQCELWNNQNCALYKQSVSATCFTNRTFINLNLFPAFVSCWQNSCFCFYYGLMVPIYSGIFCSESHYNHKRKRRIWDGVPNFWHALARGLEVLDPRSHKQNESRDVFAFQLVPL